MEPWLRNTTSQLNNIIQEIRNSTNEMILAILPVIEEGRELLFSLSTQITNRQIFHNWRRILNKIYHELVIIPRTVIMNLLQRLGKNFHLWNRSHLIAGIIGLFIGSCFTALLGQLWYAQTTNLTLMKAVVAKSENELEGICYIEEASVSLTIGPNDVLVHVRAASVDKIDLEIASENGKILRSLFQSNALKKKGCFPVLLGRDCTGIVVDVGRNVTRFEIGDEIWLTVPYWMTGTLAEFISVAENYVSHKPERLNFLDAASLPYSGCIALDCVKQRAGIFDSKSGKGKRVLVHYGNNAVGCIIIQLCSMYNANITTSCASHAMNKMIDAGAHNVLLLDQLNFDVFSMKKYDIVFNTVGEIGKEFCAKCVTNGGLIIDAFGKYYVPFGVHSSLYSNLYITWLKLMRIFGCNVWKDVPINSRILEELGELVDEGKLHPVTDCVFDVRFCKRAFWFLHATNIVGKPVLYFR